MHALLYDAQHQTYQEDLPFWLGIAAMTPMPGLELGCGSGRVYIPLLLKGFHFIGIDHDAEMLALLKRKAALRHLQERCWLIQADICQFNLSLRFGSILIPCNTYSTLNCEARQNLLERVQAHLHAEGVCVISLPNPHRLLDLPACGESQLEEVLQHPQSRNPLQISSAWQRTRNEFTLLWHYDHLLPQGQVERITLSTTHYIYPTDEELRRVRANGLIPLTIYGDFERSPFTPASPEMILVLKRAP